MLATFLVGDSHYASVAGALALRGPEAVPSEGSGAHVFVFNGWKHSLTYPFSTLVDDSWVLNPDLHAEVDRLRSGLSGPLILSMFGGGHHHALTLVGHAQPFDCILPDRADLPLIPHAQLLTVGYIEAILMAYLAGPFRDIQSFINAFPDAVFLHVEAPPSNGDDDFVRANLDRWFVDKVPAGQELKLTHRTVRQKVSRIHSDLYVKRGTEVGFTVLRTPAGAADGEGFLRPEYFGADATHANTAYGELLLQQFEAHTGESVRSWSYFG